VPSEISFKDHTLVIPSPESHGESPNLAVDLLIMNHGFSHVGYFESEHITPLVGNDILSEGEPKGKLVLPNEVYTNQEMKMTLFSFRSGVEKGRLQEFVDELEAWYKDGEFKRMVILTSTYNHVRKIRVSNVQIPKIFYYENIHFGKNSLFIPL
jgi:predicted ATP-grasp superfamily ATP-dependent carboligase